MILLVRGPRAQFPKLLRRLPGILPRKLGGAGTAKKFVLPQQLREKKETKEKEKREKRRRRANQPKKKREEHSGRAYKGWVLKG